MVGNSYRNIGRRLRAAREAAGLTQKNAADRLSVSEGTYSRYESGQYKIGVPEALSLAALFRVPPGYLLGFEEAPTPSRRTPQEITQELLENIPILLDVHSAPASAGPGTPADYDRIAYFPRPHERGHHFEAVEVVGTCMEPEIKEGHTVVYDTDTSPRPGDIVVALHEGERIVKELARVDGHLILAARQGQPPITVNEGTRILGVVTQATYRPKGRR